MKEFAMLSAKCQRFSIFAAMFLAIAVSNSQAQRKPYPRLSLDLGAGYALFSPDDINNFLAAMVDLYDFSDGPVEVMINNDKRHYIDSTGRILDFEAGDYEFSEGLAKILIDRACGYVDTTGMIAIPPLYRGGSEFSGGRASVLEFDGDVIEIDRAGKIIPKP